jgi:hypothetical protein
MSQQLPSHLYQKKFLYFSQQIFDIKYSEVLQTMLTMNTIITITVTIIFYCYYFYYYCYNDDDDY